MRKLEIVVSLVLAGVSGPVWAGHAEDDWPEPVKSYRTGQILFDRLEVTRTDNDEDVLVWDMLAWYGSDRNRIYFKSEGENQKDDGEPTELESAEVLASRLIAPFWELQGGIGTRGSLASGAERENYLVFSLFGLAPYRFEMDNSITVNEDGDIAATIEAEYDLRLTQVSYLQPRLEVAAALTDAEAYDRPTGLNDIRVGLRYRYELSREFAPYIGAYWSRSLGDKADQIRAGGGDDSETGLVIGARIWF
ncbi:MULTISPECIES: copper resistance protein B [unclassified Alcanivorax]|jgi:copper resistance protein B|uniref:copper resistance protein B n=1 Tax=unclassified Alcanivorax TaxID=2638842 RepID=UPI0008A092A2|nr:MULTISPECIES: copper resistance protein B [unclassified Alcanivorax]SEG27659.1 copper resistance protein B [Alcanivorax sp. DSM 26293]